LETVGVADRDHQLPNADGVGVAQTGRHQMRGVNAHDRHVGIGIITGEVGRLTVAVSQGGHELSRTMHDVAMSHNKAIGRKEKARAVATHVWCEARIRS
jgi:hypothetical protein